MDLVGLSAAQFETGLLIFVRISAMLFMFPIFSSKQIPSQVRLGLSLLLTILLYRTVPTLAVSPDLYGLAAAVVSQVILGVVVGFVGSLVFAGIQVAGELIDLQIGFAVANVINPTTQQQVTVIGEFELAIATLVFLGTDGHHLLIEGIAGSFSLVPLPYIGIDPNVMGSVVGFLSAMFAVVFRIAAPPAVALFITNVALAFMARVAPQMNVFVIGFPLQIGVGLIMLGISLPLLGTVGPEIFGDVAREMDAVMRGMRA